MEKIRLNKFISESGYCSRRDADIYIEQGRVTVNNKDCTEKGTLVEPTDKVKVDDDHIKRSLNHVYIAFNKPIGVTCTTDLEDKTNIIDFINFKDRIFPIGRLDKLSSGLIFLTNNGDIVNKILRAGNAHEKEYVVVVDKPISDDFIKVMSSGVRIDNSTKTLPCKITRESESQFRIVLTQGLNRQIRRMCETLHYQVKKLKRVRVMNITLSGIEEGKWRYFTQAEIDQINSMVSSSVGTKEASKLRSSSAYGKRLEDKSVFSESSSKHTKSKLSYNQYRKAGKGKRS